MEVSEPWDFNGGPVRLRVKEQSSEERWTVTVVSGWPQASEAVLAARYGGETLRQLVDGQTVAANLSAGDVGLIGTVRLDAGG